MEIKATNTPDLVGQRRIVSRTSPEREASHEVFYRETYPIVTE
jgi:hypothetical protein